MKVTRYAARASSTAFQFACVFQHHCLNRFEGIICSPIHPCIILVYNHYKYSRSRLSNPSNPSNPSIPADDSISCSVLIRSIASTPKKSECTSPKKVNGVLYCGI